ncbi:MAG: tyrosine-protein phosphatase [Deltaproteobacteria bacterium]|nr:tyrosine-protein phosphatase [Deltaproteobacteria bacterium]
MLRSISAAGAAGVMDTRDTLKKTDHQQREEVRMPMSLNRLSPVVQHLPPHPRVEQRVWAHERPKPFGRSLNAQVTQDADGNYVLSWAAEPGRQVTIYAGKSPEEMNYTTPVGRALHGGSTVISGLDAARRWYFTLKTPDCPPATVAVRRVSLQGATNFRDLGGYSTKDGRTTQWGVCFRSDALNRLTSDDMAYLKNSGLGLAVDLRMDTEVTAADGADVPAITGDMAYLRRPILYDAADLHNRISEGGQGFTEADLIQLYRQFVDEYAEAYAQVFDDLAEHGPGMVVHCTAGKDRSGVAAALVLMAVNVPDETIIADYLLTDQYYAPSVAPPYKRLDPTRIQPLLKSPPNAMQQTLNYIRTNYGGVDEYLAGGGLDAQTLAHVRAILAN